VATVAFGGTRTHSSNYWGNSTRFEPWLARGGFHLEPGCGFEDSWFLPQTLFFHEWYEGPTVYTSYAVVPWEIYGMGARWYDLGTVKQVGWRTSTTWSSIRTEDLWEVHGSTWTAFAWTDFSVGSEGDERAVRP
jgi:hypothetical protein